MEKSAVCVVVVCVDGVFGIYLMDDDYIIYYYKCLHIIW
jgi:hypothetical protein